MKKYFVYLDGRFIKVTESFVHFLAPGRLEGEGLFETMVVQKKRIVAWPQHYARLKKGCGSYKIRLNISQNKLYELAQQLLRRNRLSNARLRVVVFQQRGVMHINMISLPWRELSEEQYRQGFKACVSGVIRPESKAAHVKSMDYRVFREAYESARQKGFDEAILLNPHKEVAEGSRTNIFYIKEGVVFTPGFKSGCLDGITRQMVLSCLKDLKIKVRVAGCPVQSLKKADEVFLTNSLLGVMPLTWLNKKRFGTGRMGEITGRILYSYRKLKSMSLF